MVIFHSYVSLPEGMMMIFMVDISHCIKGLYLAEIIPGNISHNGDYPGIFMVDKWSLGEYNSEYIPLYLTLNLNGLD